MARPSGGTSARRLEGLPDRSTLHTRLLVGGEWVEPTGGETVPTIDPATNETIVDVAAAQADDVDLRSARGASARSRPGATSSPTSARGSCSVSPS